MFPVEIETLRIIYAIVGLIIGSSYENLGSTFNSYRILLKVKRRLDPICHLHERG